MSEKKKQMDLSEVALMDGGLKGIKVAYATHSFKQDRLHINSHNDKRTGPVQKELIDAFAELKGILLDICNYGADISTDIVEVTKIKAGKDNFLISGKINANISDKAEGFVISLSTPLVKEEHGYHNYLKVMGIVDRIYAEALLFMRGEKQADDQQLIMNFYAKKGQSTEGLFEGMTNEDMRKCATDIIEELGGLVYHMDEVADEEVDLGKVRAQIKERKKKNKKEDKPLAVVDSEELQEFHEEVVREEPDFTFENEAVPTEASSLAKASIQVSETKVEAVELTKEEKFLMHYKYWEDVVANKTPWPQAVVTLNELGYPEVDVDEYNEWVEANEEELKSTIPLAIKAQPVNQSTAKRKQAAA